MSNPFGTPESPEFSRRTLLRWSGAVAAAATIGTTLAACTGPASTAGSGATKTASGAAYSGPSGDITAVVGYGNNQSWDPSQTASAFTMAANRHIYEGLVTTDLVTGKASPALGTALPSDTGATTWKFSLRKGAKFHDGTDVTADDVVFSFERVLDPSTLMNEFFAGWLASVDKVDDSTVELKLNYPFPLGVQRLELAKIMPKHAYTDWTAVATGTGQIIGSGPYKVTQNNLGTNTQFAAFTDYNGSLKPNFSTMNWFSITDPNALIAKVLSGAAIVTDNVPTNNVSSISGAGMKVGEAKGMDNIFMMFNTGQKPFDDVRVRQALFYAIDVQKLIKVGLNGYGDQPQSFLPEQSGFKPASTVYKHNLSKAKQLLKDAGVDSGLKINILATNTSYVVNSLNVIQEGWEALGFTVTQEPQATAALFTKMDQDASYQVVIASSNPEQFGTDPDLLMRYNYTKGGLWMKYTKWDSSPEATALFAAMNKAAKEADQTKRNAQIQANLDTIAKNAVLYPVVFVDMLTAWYPKKVTGVPALPIPGIDLREAKLVA
ncbi:ABC transporter substrate-binding protein [Rathayibacter sp. CAU 1779]